MQDPEDARVYGAFISLATHQILIEEKVYYALKEPFEVTCFNIQLKDSCNARKDDNYF